jgi:hypothetical protein
MPSTPRARGDHELDLEIVVEEGSDDMITDLMLEMLYSAG